MRWCLPHSPRPWSYPPLRLLPVRRQTRCYWTRSLHTQAQPNSKRSCLLHNRAQPNSMRWSLPHSQAPLSYRPLRLLTHRLQTRCFSTQSLHNRAQPNSEHWRLPHSQAPSSYRRQPLLTHRLQTRCSSTPWLHSRAQPNSERWCLPRSRGPWSYRPQPLLTDRRRTHCSQTPWQPRPARQRRPPQRLRRSQPRSTASHLPAQRCLERCCHLCPRRLQYRLQPSPCRWLANKTRSPPSAHLQPLKPFLRPWSRRRMPWRQGPSRSRGRRLP